jgi:putative ABC transport system ATP-binding protein
MGPSGSGKSTLLSCLGGLDEPQGGSVRIAGTVLTHRSEGERARLRAQLVGLLFQHDNLLGHLSVEDNIELVQRLSRGRPSRRRRHELLEQLGLAQLAAAAPRQLSGGESVRAGLALALVGSPPVLLADEPTGELDATTEGRVLALLRARARAGGAVVVASHSAAVAAAADRVLTLVDGQLR